MSEESDVESTVADEFDRMGRRAGAELRGMAPADGHRRIRRAATQRRVAMIAAPVCAVVAVLAAFVVLDDGARGADSVTDDPAVPAPSLDEVVEFPDRVDLIGRGDMVTTFAVSADGRYIAAAASFFNDPLVSAVQIWDASTGEEVQLITLDVPAPVEDLEFSPDGSTVAVLSPGGQGAGPAACAMSPDGSTVAVRSSGGQGARTTSSFWDTGDGTLGDPFDVWHDPGELRDCVQSPDGTTSVTGIGLAGLSYVDRGARLVDSETAATIRRLTDEPGALQAAYSPDGSTVAVKTNDRVQMWRLGSLEELRAIDFTYDGGTAEQLEFTSDSRRVVFTAGDSVVVAQVDPAS